MFSCYSFCPAVVYWADLVPPMAKRYVYRALKKKEINANLIGQEVRTCRCHAACSRVPVEAQQKLQRGVLSDKPQITQRLLTPNMQP